MSDIQPHQIIPPAETPSAPSMVPPPAVQIGQLGGRNGPPPKRRLANLDPQRVQLLILFQTAVAAGLLIICFALGASAWFWGTGLIVTAGLLYWIDRLMLANAKTPDPLASDSLLLKLMKGGVVLTFVTLFTTPVALGLRLDWQKHLVLGVFMTLYLMALAVLMYVLSNKAIKNQTTPWLSFAVGVTAIPILIAWIAASTVSYFLNPRLSATKWMAKAENMSEARQKWAAHDGWRTPDGDPITVGLTLSGGGYRAAVVHAGVLHALDKHCVPIQYLSTVSGGSIIGTFYALGYAPEQFRRILTEAKPGLPDNIMNIGFVFLELYSPVWSSADTYAWHFRQVFFDKKKLSDLNSGPRLFINATGITEPSETALEVFYRDRPNHDSADKKKSDLNDTALADAVAASGAFPGAFQTMRLPWLTPDGQIETRRFIDGGVVDNLGTSGLTKVLNGGGMGKALPSILLVSDVGKTSEPAALPYKVDPVTLMGRSYGLTHDTLHHAILKDLETSSYLYRIPISSKDTTALQALQKETYTVAKDQLNEDVDKLTMDGVYVAKQVGKIETLRELEAPTVNMAFWLGERLGEIAWSDSAKGIEAARLRLGKKGPSCPSIP